MEMSDILNKQAVASLKNSKTTPCIKYMKT